MHAPKGLRERQNSAKRTKRSNFVSKVTDGSEILVSREKSVMDAVSDRQHHRLRERGKGFCKLCSELCKKGFSRA